MYFYEVWVSSPRYHRDYPLTYSCDQRLEPDSIVVIPLQHQKVLGLVIRAVNKPKFAVKEITKSVSATPLPAQLTKLVVWMKDYYPAPLGQIMNLVLPSGLAKEHTAVSSKYRPKNKAIALPELTPEQSKAVNAIRRSSKPALIHGDTGTGKTRIYLELIKDTLNKEKSALLLTPEIGLTPQLAGACETTFPGRTVVVHSNLTPHERHETWLKVLESSQPLVVVGARSALFAPIKSLGLIVVDECHENTYKQEQAPHYLTTRVAGALASLHNARLILGSATPTISDYYTFEQKRLPIIRLREPALGHSDQPIVEIIDLKHRNQFIKSPWISNNMLSAIKTAMKQGEQTLLFLNRRGSARMVICQNCGWQAACPHCDVSLTYHADDHKVCCHICGFSATTPVSCPDCSSPDIIFRVIGTKALMTELKHLFPYARLSRFDSDTKKAERLEHIYEKLEGGEIDILVGTQMLGKGLDLPRLSVLGVVLADTSLSFPDYTAEERTFQLLTQVAGRVNRGHLPGKIYIQTHHPDSHVLGAALNKDYETFYGKQIAERRLYGFPPFRFTLKLTCSYATQQKAKLATMKLAKELKKRKDVEVVGPSPAFIEKVKGRYKWQIILKSVDRSRLLDIIKQLPPRWSYDIDPVNLL